MKRSLFLIPIAVLLVGMGANAESFDGTYSGKVQLSPGLSAATCGESAPLTVVVKGGSFSSASPKVSGFVNVKAFVTGKIQIADRTLPIEGRVTENQDDGVVHLTAGVVDSAAHCDWTIDLKKQ